MSAINAKNGMCLMMHYVYMRVGGPVALYSVLLQKNTHHFSSSTQIQYVTNNANSVVLMEDKFFEDVQHEFIYIPVDYGKL